MGRYRDTQRLGYALPHRESIKHPYGNTKSLNEHLGPLCRYLDSQVGQPWDRVFAEICKHIRLDSAVQSHVRDHVMQFVQVNTILINGVPCSGDTWGYGRPLAGSWRWRSWYVCPLSGILKRVEHRSRKRHRAENATRAASPSPGPVRVDATHVCKVIRGRWCLVEVRSLPQPPVTSAGWKMTRPTVRDVLLGRRACDLTPKETATEYGAAVYAVGWRPLSRKEMHNLPVPIDLWKQRRWWTAPGKGKRA
jgi:hypothetical protein